MDLARILNDCTVAEPSQAPVKQRTGKWSDEEERYASTLVRYFVDGSLTIPTGTSLRSFLAKKLRCSAMRVSTKLSMDVLGDLKIPKKLGQKRFFPREGLSGDHKQRVACELSSLEVVFLQKENLPVELDIDEATIHTDLTYSSTNSNASGDEGDGPMRVGSWSEEEQGYACELIDAFLRGLVNISEGVTLRAFLADRLCCNPMRISKRLATGKMGGSVIPKRLGSATYVRSAPIESDIIAETEFHLEQARSSCFSTVQDHQPHPHLHAPPPHTQERTLTMPAQQSYFQSNNIHINDFKRPQEDKSPRLRSPQYLKHSRVLTGVKRKLPSLSLPTEPYLPPLKTASWNMPRLHSVAATASY